MFAAWADRYGVWHKQGCIDAGPISCFSAGFCAWAGEPSARTTRELFCALDWHLELGLLQVCSRRALIAMDELCGACWQCPAARHHLRLHMCFPVVARAVGGQHASGAAGGGGFTGQAPAAARAPGPLQAQGLEATAGAAAGAKVRTTVPIAGTVCLLRHSTWAWQAAPSWPQRPLAAVGTRHLLLPLSRGVRAQDLVNAALAPDTQSSGAPKKGSACVEALVEELLAGRFNQASVWLHLCGVLQRLAAEAAQQQAYLALVKGMPLLRLGSAAVGRRLLDGAGAQWQLRWDSQGS